MRLTIVAIVMVAALPFEARAQQPVAAPASSFAGIPGRIVGVYDNRSGLPIADARVEDVLSGMSVVTTATGTAKLFFVDSGGTLLRIKKVGYLPLLFPVKNSDRDTVPITVVLQPAAQLLPGAVITGRSSRGPADTVRRLDLTGFYDRQHTTGAPLSAFVTEEKIKRFTLLSDVSRLTNRPFCTGSLYLDGMLLTIPNFEPDHGVRTQAMTKKGIDLMFNPEDILAIEFYRPADVPAGYNMTSASQSCGATLMWTR